MESFRTDDNTVGKYMHDDGSETAIKCVSSCDTIIDPVTRQYHLNNVDRNKYSIFISSSVGCFMKCKFCYLTIKNSPYSKLTEDRLWSNVSEALQDELVENPGIKNKYAKICWMSMGEDHMLQPSRTRSITTRLLDSIIADGNAVGLDGIDVSTVMPKGVPPDWIDQYAMLEHDLVKYNINPYNIKSVHASNNYIGNQQRSRFRLFYSLHSAIQEERTALIPNAKPLADAVPELDAFHDKSGCNLIFHQMFMDGQNDSDRSVDALLEFMRKCPQHELRILRYNACYYTPFGESPKFDEIITRLSSEVPRLKVQVSVGKEVAAACGQFIVKNWANPASTN